MTTEGIIEETTEEIKEEITEEIIEEITEEIEGIGETTIVMITATEEGTTGM